MADADLGARLLAIAGLHGLGAADLLALWLQFLMLSFLSVGGAIVVAPDMRRYLVDQQGWLDADGFNASIALAQAAPGPNVLFVALLGWQAAGLAGSVATMSGILLPSCTLAWAAGRLGHRHAAQPLVRAFPLGMTPLTLGLLASTAWLLVLPLLQARPWATLGPIGLSLPTHWGAAVLALMVVFGGRLTWPPLAWMVLGAVVGAFGWV